MVVLAPFPNIERALIALYANLVVAGSVFRDLPADGVKPHMPAIRVWRTGGGDQYIEDRPVVDIDVFAATYAAGTTLAEQVRQRTIATPYVVTVGGDPVVIDHAVTSSAPREIPWGDTGVRRWIASYTLALRR